MRSPRSVVVSLQTAGEYRSAIEIGVEFATLFRAPVAALYVENTNLPVLCDLPTVFQPIGFTHSQTMQSRRAMMSALARETEKVRVEIQQLAAQTKVEFSVFVQRGTLPEHLARIAAAEDLVVCSVDLSEPRLLPTIHGAIGLCPRAGGVVIVPERRPTRAGPVVVVADGADDAGIAVAAEIAAGVDASLLILLTDPNDIISPDIRDDIIAQIGGKDRLVVRNLLKDQKVDAAAIGPDAARVIICSEQSLDRILLDGRESPMRRHRSALLVLAADKVA